MALRRVPDGPREWDIVGVGDIDVDMFLGVTELPGRDEKVLGELLGEHPGGMIANVCCAASRLGANTAMAGRVGTDAYAELALQSLRDHGVHTSLVRVVPGGRTFYCVIMLDGSGEKALTAVDTDCHLPRREDVDPDCFARTRLVHTMGDDLETVSWVVEEARARHALVSLDLEASTAAHGLPTLRTLLARTDILFMNSSGCRQAFRTDPLTAVRAVLELGPQIVVATGGAHGVLAADQNGAVKVDALRVPVVDTTGAGDCFIGAFLARLLDGSDVPSAARYGVAAASFSIGSVGSRSALPTHDMALAAMDQTVAVPA